MKLIDLLKKAKEKQFAIGAFNVDSLEVFRAIIQTSAEQKVTVIVEASPGEVKSLGVQNILAIKNNLCEEYGAEVFLNIDHAEDIDVINSAIELGFDMVHFDGSKLPFDENLTTAQQIITMAHNNGVIVEGEIDQIGQEVTGIEQAKSFVEETGVDIFAVNIGNKHGVGENEKLDLELLQKIHETLPDTFFSLHGGSGISEEDIKAAIKLGIVKVNVNTELRISFRETLENMLKGNPDELAWYKLTTPAVEEVKIVVGKKLKLFS